MKNTLDVVVGGQFGSESKGRVTGDLTMRRKAAGASVIGVRVGGPNAGHVVIDASGTRWAFRQLPVSLVLDPMATGVIAAGSEIDLDVLRGEVEAAEAAGHKIRSRLLIDAQATILTPVYRMVEGGNDGPLQNRIGSTGKGVGAARAERIWRQAPIAGDKPHQFADLGALTDTQRFLNAAIRHHRGIGQQAVIIEGTQGYGLGLHAGFYPFCTSGDCRAVDFLAQAGIHPLGSEWRTFAWVVLRAYPIRVAGNSGPLRDETSWEALGLPEERTTVTNKVRRVGGWDAPLARAAVEANGGKHALIALAMADQKYPAIAGIEDWEQACEAEPNLEGWVKDIEGETGAQVVTVGTSPTATIVRQGQGGWL